VPFSQEVLEGQLLARVIHLAVLSRTDEAVQSRHHGPSGEWQVHAHYRYLHIGTLCTSHDDKLEWILFVKRQVAKRVTSPYSRFRGALRVAL
jgi:hypothetical protein